VRARKGQEPPSLPSNPVVFALFKNTARQVYDVRHDPSCLQPNHKGPTPTVFGLPTDELSSVEKSPPGESLVDGYVVLGLRTLIPTRVHYFYPPCTAKIPYLDLCISRKGIARP
jgi:hypothetical protein